jgi:hypothetical protein
MTERYVKDQGEWVNAYIDRRKPQTGYNVATDPVNMCLK